ncbi:transposase [Streptomyces sp. NPDC127051]|uniref:transposase n=1 Tax=Streptomyces sp. NPDC127051 TaxID=3347119 RepID=UPI003661D36B
MTRRLPCPPAPGPLEAYAARFDDLFSTLAQRRGFREYLAGRLLPRDRNKTLTCLAGAEPVAGAQHPAVQRLQFFLSESAWDHERVNTRRVELLLADPATAPHAGGVLVIDDSGDRKDGTATAHVGRQWLGRLGKTVTVTTCWADENLCYPLHTELLRVGHRSGDWQVCVTDKAPGRLSERSHVSTRSPGSLVGRLSCRTGPPACPRGVGHDADRHPCG